MEPLTILALIVAFMVAMVCHEAAHAYVADRLGDPTARMQGRVTLNPIPHVDIFGTLLLPGIMIIAAVNIGFPLVFGWAKPVPVNPYNFANPIRDRLITALSGPFANLLVATIAAIVARLFVDFGEIPMLLGLITLINLVLMVFNLIPIPPLDGSAILPYLFRRSPDVLYFIEQRGTMILVLLLMVHFLTGGALLSLVFYPVRLLASLLLGPEVLSTFL
jgi:Zn-dependent protease